MYLQLCNDNYALIAMHRQLYIGSYVMTAKLVNIQYCFCVKSIHFNLIEMNKNKTSPKQTDLETLYKTDDLALLKKSIAELANKQDYMTPNTPFRLQT